MKHQHLIGTALGMGIGTAISRYGVYSHWQNRQTDPAKATDSMIRTYFTLGGALVGAVAGMAVTARLTKDSRETRKRLADDTMRNYVNQRVRLTESTPHKGWSWYRFRVEVTEDDTDDGNTYDEDWYVYGKTLQGAERKLKSHVKDTVWPRYVYAGMKAPEGRLKYPEKARYHVRPDYMDIDEALYAVPDKSTKAKKLDWYTVDVSGAPYKDGNYYIWVINVQAHNKGEAEDLAYDYYHRIHGRTHGIDVEASRKGKSRRADDEYRQSSMGDGASRKRRIKSKTRSYGVSTAISKVPHKATFKVGGKTYEVAIRKTSGGMSDRDYPAMTDPSDFYVRLAVDEDGQDPAVALLAIENLRMMYGSLNSLDTPEFKREYEVAKALINLVKNESKLTAEVDEREADAMKRMVEWAERNASKVKRGTIKDKS